VLSSSLELRCLHRGALVESAGRCSEAERYWVVIRCIHLVVNPARAGPYGSANKCPINPVSLFKQSVRGSGRSARRRYCILKSSSGKRETRRTCGSIQFEITRNNYGRPAILRCRIRQDLLDLRETQFTISPAFHMEVVGMLLDKTTAPPWPRESQRYSARSAAE